MTHKLIISNCYGVYIACFGSGRGNKLPGVSGKQNSLDMLYIVEFS